MYLGVPLSGQKSYKSIQIKQIRALALKDFEQICGIYFPSLREQFSKVAYATQPRPLVLAVGDSFFDSSNMFTWGSK